MMKTIDEWDTYISTLEGEDLRSKWRAANSLQFVEMLKSENTPPITISTILKLFVRQLILTGQEPPQGGYVDAATIIENDTDMKRMYLEMVHEDQTPGTSPMQS